MNCRKTLSFTFMVIVVLTINSCLNPSSSSDRDSSGSEQGVIGVWEAVKMESGESMSDLREVPLYSVPVIEFTVNGEFKLDEVVNGTYREGRLYVEYEDESIFFGGYEIDEDQLIVFTQIDVNELTKITFIKAGTADYSEIVEEELLGLWKAMEYQTGDSESDLTSEPFQDPFFIEFADSGRCIIRKHSVDSGTYANGTLRIQAAGYNVHYGEYELIDNRLYIDVSFGTPIVRYIFEKVDDDPVDGDPVDGDQVDGDQVDGDQGST
ncbi:hypothetical protein QA601_16810 [Chitinispirillales bacterium ANBcel5]|uniref:hypothetical protein n=1 Tax=Cellulosispirillum alkaliphilum TaxID=3039283 RepID=UPI002A519AE4|nr:hypothetical protein [Chitinispirillales bacterium ANBcel5]